jgi:hypothetical protein
VAKNWQFRLKMLDYNRKKQIASPEAMQHQIAHNSNHFAQQSFDLRGIQTLRQLTGFILLWQIIW